MQVRPQAACARLLVPTPDLESRMKMKLLPAALLSLARVCSAQYRCGRRSESAMVKFKIGMVKRADRARPPVSGKECAPPC